MSHFDNQLAIVLETEDWIKQAKFSEYVLNCDYRSTNKHDYSAYPHITTHLPASLDRSRPKVHIYYDPQTAQLIGAEYLDSYDMLTGKPGPSTMDLESLPREALIYFTHLVGRKTHQPTPRPQAHSTSIDNSFSAKLQRALFGA